MVKYRRYTDLIINGKRYRNVKAWMQNRCEKCQRFLTKHDNKLCKKCVLIHRREYKTIYSKEKRHNLGINKRFNKKRNIGMISDLHYKRDYMRIYRSEQK
jgi:hypothetical protein